MSDPLRVTTFTAEAAERPCSAEKRFVAIWNSWTASCGRLASGPPTTSSLLSCPSIVMLPPRPSWPAEEMARLFDFVGSKLGAGALPGRRKASSRKFRPFRGRLSTTPDETTPPTRELPVAMGTVRSSTVTASARPPTSRTASTGTRRPTSTTTRSSVFDTKPGASIETRYSPGARLAST